MRMTKEDRRVARELGEVMKALSRRDRRYKQLFDTLLSFGGFSVAAVEEPDLKEILERGYLASGRRAGLVRGRPSSCHENSARLWAENPDSVTIVTGWALSKDGLWRQHTWIKGTVDGRIYETTGIRRDAYYGFDLTRPESKGFHKANVLHRT